MNAKPYPEYKESGVQWLGNVPEHWVVKSARFDYAIQLGKMLQPEAASPSDQETPYLKAQHVQWESVRTTDLPIMWASLSDRSKYGVCDGDLLVCEGGDVGRSRIVCNPPDATIIQNALHRVRSRHADLRYLMFVLEHAASQNWFEILCNRATIAHFTGEKFGALQIPTPPLSEQTAIADFLDRETGRIDALVAKKRRLIELLKEKRTALISRTVTRGLPADAAREFSLEPHARFKASGIDWLGEVPEGWDALPLRRLIKFVKTGNTPSGAEAYHFEDGGFNWYSPSDFSDAVYLGLASRALSAEGKAGVRIFPEMTVMLVGIGATIGKVGLAANKCSCNQQINAIICNNKLDPVFATYHLKTMRDFIVKCGKFTTLPIINQDETKNLILTVPPLSEQTAIATYLDRETSKIDRLVEKVESAVGRLQEYRTALITAAVTGKIDVREAV